jgi:hypothetical protein
MLCYVTLGDTVSIILHDRHALNRRVACYWPRNRVEF